MLFTGLAAVRAQAPSAGAAALLTAPQSASQGFARGPSSEAHGLEPGRLSWAASRSRAFSRCHTCSWGHEAAGWPDHCLRGGRGPFCPQVQGGGFPGRLVLRWVLNRGSSAAARPAAPQHLQTFPPELVSGGKFGECLFQGPGAGDTHAPSSGRGRHPCPFRGGQPALLARWGAVEVGSRPHVSAACRLPGHKDAASL